MVKIRSQKLKTLFQGVAQEQHAHLYLEEISKNNVVIKKIG